MSLSIGVLVSIFAFALLKSVNVIIAPIMTRILSPNDYGVISIYNTWSSFIGILAQFGIIGSLTNFRTKYRNEEYFKYCWNVLWVGILGHLFFFILLFCTKVEISELISLPANLITLLPLTAVSNYCVSFLCTYFIIENMVVHNCVTSLFTVVGSFIISVIIIKLFYGNSNMYLPFILGHIIVYFFVSLICIIYFAYKGCSIICIDYVKYGLGIGLPLVFHSLAGIIFGSSDRIMIQRIDGLSEAGVYSFTYNFASIISSIWAAINSIWTPFLFRFLKNNEYNSMFIKKKNFDFTFTVMSVCFVLVYPEVFRLLANERYWIQIKVVPIIVIAFFANHLYSFPTNYETYKEKTIFVALGSIGAAAVNILLNFALIPILHEYGAAIATAISYIVLFILHLFIATKIIGGYPFTEVIAKTHLMAFIFSIILIYLIFDFWLVRWIIAFCLGTFWLINSIRKKTII